MTHTTIYDEKTNEYSCTACAWRARFVGGRLEYSSHGDLGATHTAFRASNDIQVTAVVGYQLDGVDADVLDQIEGLDFGD